MTATAPEIGLSYQILDHIPGFTWVHDDETDRTLWISSYWYQYAGEKRGGLVSDTIARVIHAEDLTPMMAAWKTNRRRGTSYTSLARYRNARGQYRWHRYTVRREGQLWYGIAVDVHAEAKAIEQRVTAAEAMALGRQATSLFGELRKTIWGAVLAVVVALACAALWAVYRLGGL